MIAKKKNSQGENKSFIIKFVFFFLIVATIFSSLHYAFTVKYVQCLANDVLIENNCVEFDQFKGKSLFFYDFEQDEQAFTFFQSDRSNKVYQVESIDKKLPDTLLITVKEQNPVYKIKLATEEIFVVSLAGQLNKDETSLDLPVINIKNGYEQQMLDGERVLEQQWHDFLVTLLTALEDHQISYQAINVYSHEVLLVTLDNSLSVLLQRDSNSRLKIDQLSLILRELDLKEVDLAIREIDLRFNLPVLKTKQTSY